jgi:hypothetical protein
MRISVDFVSTATYEPFETFSDFKDSVTEYLAEQDPDLDTEASVSIWAIEGKEMFVVADEDIYQVALESSLESGLRFMVVKNEE